MTKSSEPGLYAEILQRGGGGGANLPYFKQLQAVSGGTLEDNVVPHSTVQPLMPYEAPEELSESNLNEFIDVWQCKSTRISV